MHTTRRFTIIFRLFIAFVLMVGTASIGVAQTLRQVSPEAKGDTASHKHPRPAPRYSRYPADTVTGQLILDGKLIPGPYEIIIQDSTIRVNGIIALALPKGPRQAEQRTDIEIDSNVMAKYKVDEAFARAFRNWETERGFDTACTLAVGYMRRQPLVDSAYWMGPGAFCVFYEGDRDPNVFELYPHMDPEPPDPNRWQKVLEFVAGGLKGALHDGSLVIMQNGQCWPISPPKRMTVLKQLQDIVASEPDMEKRIAAIKKIVRDERSAKAIAEKLAPR